LKKIIFPPPSARVPADDRLAGSSSEEDGAYYTREGMDAAADPRSETESSADGRAGAAAGDTLMEPMRSGPLDDGSRQRRGGKRGNRRGKGGKGQGRGGSGDAGHGHPHGHHHGSDPRASDASAGGHGVPPPGATRESSSNSTIGDPTHLSAREPAPTGGSSRKTSDILVFRYGVFVCWDLGEVEESAVLYQMRPYEKEPYRSVESESFDAVVSGSRLRMINDIIHLTEGADTLTRVLEKVRWGLWFCI
jgi:uncharacterized Rmd1/YagE family protein